MADAPSPGKRPWFRFFRRPKTPNSRVRREDLTIAALGITLGLICALFPWYIFFNPDQFGIRAIEFSGNSPTEAPAMAQGAAADRLGAPMSIETFSPENLDLFATGTTGPKPEGEDAPAPAVEDQPFPGPKPVFRVVHITSGRAMIADDAGLFLVQPGSVLPDNSHVASIEKRDGHWVVVTSDEQVLPVVK